MIKRFVLSSIVCAVVIAIPNAIITPLFYYEFLKQHSGLSPDLWAQVQRPAAQTEIAPTLMSILLIGLLMTLIIYWTKARTYWEGFKYAFIVGALMMGVVNLGLLGTTYYYSYTSAITDIFVAATTFAIGGGVAALIVGREHRAK